MINKSPEFVLFTTPPREKTIFFKKGDHTIGKSVNSPVDDRPPITLQVYTVATMIPPGKSDKDKQISNGFIRINTIHYPTQSSNSEDAVTYRVLCDRKEVAGEIDPVEVYRATLLADHSEKVLIDTSRASSLSTHITYAGTLRLSDGTIFQAVKTLRGEGKPLWLTMVEHFKEKKLRERPLIDNLLRADNLTEEDLQNLVKQDPPKKDLRRTIRNLHQHGVPVKGGLLLYVASYLPEIPPHPRPSLRIPSLQS